MREVAVIGAGSTKFGELWDKSFRALGIEAGAKALSDANLGGREVDALYIGNMSAGRFINQQHIDALIADYTGFANKHIPATRIEAGGASGGVAFRQGVMAVASGMHDVVVVGAAEKETDMDDSSISEVLSATADAEWEAGMGLTMPSLYAMLGRRMVHEGLCTREEIAACAVNSHHHGTKNPDAQFRSEITVDTILKAEPVAEPLTVFDGAPISDGACAVILCPLDKAKEYTDTYAKVSAAEQASDTLAMFQRRSSITFEATKVAARRAYETAGINPSDIDVAEVHDEQTVGGVMALQDLGLYPVGKAGRAFLDGDTYFDAGRIAVNTDGGLKAKGYPIGATGVSQIVEIFKQLTNQAGDRQVKDARYGLAQSVGGTGSAVTVSILEAI